MAKQTNSRATERPVITQDPEKPIERSVLACQIIEMSRAVRRIEATGLNFEAILILTHHRAGVGIGTCRAVLSALGDLEAQYTTAARQ
jgi:hypothetical protein